MRPVKYSHRRRRLRLIQAEGERSLQQFESAASALTNAADSEAVRMDAEAFRRRLFVECRGKTDTKLRVEHPGAEPLTVVMDRPFLLIGSDSECDLILEHDEIAPRHCLLHWVDSHIFCCHLAPRSKRVPAKQQPPNGCWLNNEPIAIGPFQLLLDKPTSLPEPESSPLDRSPGLMSDFPQFALQFQGVEQSDNQWPVNRVVTMIGRGSQCKLRLNHPSMPIVQACLIRTKNGCWLIDVLGAGTTGVNNRAITIAPIDIGDVLQLGPFQVEVVTTVFNPVDFETGATKTKLPSEAPQSPLPVTTVSSKLPAESSRSRALESPLSELARSESGQTESGQTESFQTEPFKGSPHRESAFEYDFQSMLEVRAPNQSTNEFPRGSLDSMIGLAATDRASGSPLLAILEPVSMVVTPSAASVPAVPALSPANRHPECVRDFIQAQQSNLVLMRAHLDQLKRLLDQASGRSNSKRVKSLLDCTMNDALTTHDSMAETLGKLIEMMEIDAAHSNS